MTPFDDNPPDPTLQKTAFPTEAQPESQEPTEPALAGERIPYGAAFPPSTHAQPPTRDLPEDLRVPWSWVHFVVFFFFALGSFVMVQTALVIYYAPRQHLTPKQLEQYLLNKPQFLFGSNLLWYAMIFLFLYVTVSVLRGAPFWRSLGWKNLSSVSASKGGPWVYFFSGCGLSLLVNLASSRVHTPENIPIQEVLRNPNTAMLLMAMAVLIAPLVEETVFRGYLYPLFAKSFGIPASILLTGTLFGLMHGAQLGWTWGIVGLLILVGVIFTFARAYTGTVLASYLLHLGYNSLIAVATVIGTKGFTHIPPP